MRSASVLAAGFAAMAQAATVAVSGTPEGFAASVTGGGDAEAVYPTTTDELYVLSPPLDIWAMFPMFSISHVSLQNILTCHSQGLIPHRLRGSGHRAPEDLRLHRYRGHHQWLRLCSLGHG